MRSESPSYIYVSFIHLEFIYAHWYVDIQGGRSIDLFVIVNDFSPTECLRILLYDLVVHYPPGSLSSKPVQILDWPFYACRRRWKRRTSRLTSRELKLLEI